MQPLLNVLYINLLLYLSKIQFHILKLIVLLLYKVSAVLVLVPKVLLDVPHIVIQMTS
jgi:hypothetical protein